MASRWLSTVLANPVKAHRLYTVGKTTISGKLINLPGKQGPAKLEKNEAIRKALGFQPLSDPNSPKLKIIKDLVDEIKIDLKRQAPE
ncbi:MAG: hypothetical protein JRH15_22805 [Deltaproteobacteria bacterium]|nr:hypothetical protein [Deltaproteobacteria bacterium]